MTSVYGFLFRFALAALVNLALHPGIALAKTEAHRLAAQVMMVGIQGPTPTDFEQRHLRDLRPGSYVLFSRNIKTAIQTKNLTNELQKLCGLERTHQCLIGVDQEGGLVSRIPGRHHFFSPRLLAELSPENTETMASEVGQTLKSLGLNWNLAPVLDLQNASGTSFLRTRAFSYDPTVVGTYGLAFSRGLLSAGVLPTAKHFPGLGSAEKDPHFHNSVASEDSNLLRSHLMPFRQFVDDDMPVIMMSHSVYPTLDPLNPASHSSKIVNELLRKTFGFKGLIVSDDLHMVAAQNEGGLGESAVRALEAGVDVVMVSYSIKAQRAVHRAIVSALQSGRLSHQVMQQKIQRQQRAINRIEGHRRTVASAENNSALSFRNSNLEKLNTAAFRVLLSKKEFRGTSTVYVLNPRLYRLLAGRYGNKIKRLDELQSVPRTATIAIDKPADLSALTLKSSNLADLTLLNFSQKELNFPNKIEKPKSIINVFGPHYQILDIVFRFKPSKPMKSQHEVSVNLE